MTKDFSGLGYDAFVMPVQSGGSTLYRVRIGPFAERAAADDALATIRKRVANAAVVAHP
jgi:cell division septation protein DedD